jgi:hypothetical protein
MNAISVEFSLVYGSLSPLFVIKLFVARVATEKSWPILDEI